MADYIETQGKNGTVVRIEVERGGKQTAGFGRSSGEGDATTEATRDSYAQMLGVIQACAGGVVDTLQAMDPTPAAASIDFGIRFDVQAGAMVAKSIGESQFKVSVSWKQPEPEKDDDDD